MLKGDNIGDWLEHIRRSCRVHSSFSEEDALIERKRFADDALRKFIGPVQQPFVFVPTISIACSGRGGLRAYANTLGFLKGLRESCFLDCVSYVAGAGASAWAIVQCLLSSSGDTLTLSSFDCSTSPLAELHLFAEFLGKSLLQDDQTAFSKVADLLRFGSQPIPILTAVTKNFPQTGGIDWKFVEFTPFEVRMCSDDSEDAQPIESFPADFKTLLAIWGSAVDTSCGVHQREDVRTGFARSWTGPWTNGRSIELYDAGVNLCVPFPVLINSHRKVDVVVVLDDMESQKENDTLTKAVNDGYFQVRFKDELAPVSLLNDSERIRVFWPPNSRQPVILYWMAPEINERSNVPSHFLTNVFDHACVHTTRLLGDIRNVLEAIVLRMAAAGNGVEGYAFVRGDAVFRPPPPLSPGHPKTVVSSKHQDSPRVSPFNSFPPEVSEETGARCLRVQDVPNGLSRRGMIHHQLYNAVGLDDGAHSKLYSQFATTYTGESNQFVYRTDVLQGATSVCVVLWGLENIRLSMVNDSGIARAAIPTAAVAVTAVLGPIGVFVAATAALAYIIEADFMSDLAQNEMRVDRGNCFLLEQLSVPASCDSDSRFPFFPFKLQLNNAFPATNAISGRGFSSMSVKYFDGDESFRDRSYTWETRYFLGFFRMREDGKKQELLHVLELPVLTGRPPSAESIPRIISDRWALTQRPIAYSSGRGHEEQAAMARDRRQRAREFGIPENSLTQRVIGYLTGANEDFFLLLSCPAIIYKEHGLVNPESLSLGLEVRVLVKSERKTVTSLQVALTQTCYFDVCPLGEPLLPRARSLTDRHVFIFEHKLKKVWTKGEHFITFAYPEVKEFCEMDLNDPDGKIVDTPFLESFRGIEATIITQLKVQCKVRGGDDICASVFPILRVCGAKNHISQTPLMRTPAVPLEYQMRFVNDRYGYLNEMK